MLKVPARLCGSGPLRRSILAITFTSCIVLVLPGESAFASGSANPNFGATPDLIACPSSGNFYFITSQTKTEYGVGTEYEVHNQGKNTVDYDPTFSHSYTFSGSVSISGGGSVDLVIATISASVGFTVGVTVTNSVDQSIPVDVPAGDYGIIQEADEVVSTTGTYGTYDGGSISRIGQECPGINESTVTASTTETNLSLYEADGTATSSTPPWAELS